MSDDPIVIVGPDGHGYVPIAEHERTRRIKKLYQKTLIDIAQRMNALANDLDVENTSLTDETRPAPLGD